MNAFFEHHKHNIVFNYRCFDRLLLNGLIQPFQQPERVIGFLGLRGIVFEKCGFEHPRCHGRLPAKAQTPPGTVCGSEGTRQRHFAGVGAVGD
jgi:hypothetical protein